MTERRLSCLRGVAPPPPTREKTATAAKPILVLRKVAAILDAFEDEGWGLSARRVAELAGLAPSTCRRLLANLVEGELLERAGERYYPGRRLKGAGRAAGAGAWSIGAHDVTVPAGLAQPVLDRLRDETGETALLFVRDGRARAIVALAPTRHVVVYAVSIGQLSALYAGSAGRVLLAFDPEATEQVLAGDLVRFTPSTITDPDRLRENLAEIRQRGYAMSSEERAPGVAAVSAPVFGPGRNLVAAVGIAGPSQRLDALARRRCHPTVMLAAQELSAALAFDPRRLLVDAGRSNPPTDKSGANLS